jgi:probable rRNA maturation factor
MIKIYVFSEEKAWTKKIKNVEFFFERISQAFPKRYKFPYKQVSCSLLLSNNKKIKKLNKDFRNKNKATDVLSFPLNEKIKISKKIYIGDIVISYNFINKPKFQNIKIFEKKLIETFVHGFLHLLGFDHVKNIDYLKMLKEEKKIYQSVISKLN